MSIAPDPKTDNIDTSDDDFGKHFEEFAAAKAKGEPAPSSEEPTEDDEPEGNDQPKEPAAPAEDETPAATEEGDEGEPVTSGDAKDTEGGSQPPKEEQAPDPWADAPEPLKAELAKLQKERDEALHKAKSDASRVAALSRKLQQVQTAPAPAKAPEPTEAQKALDGKIEQLKKDYGDIAEPLIELIESQKKELDSVRTTLHGLNEAQQAQVIVAETQALEARHPDWREIAQSKDFQEWLVIQPPNIQGLAESWDARETSVVLTLFKTEAGVATGQTEEPRQDDKSTDAKPKADAATGARRSQQLEGGRDVRSRPAPAASEPPDDFDAAFKYFEEKRRQKQALAAR